MKFSLHRKSCTSPYYLSFSPPILPKETHYFIRCDSSLGGLSALYSFSTSTRQLASCISTQNVGDKSPGPYTCAVPTDKTCHTPHPSLYTTRCHGHIEEHRDTCLQTHIHTLNITDIPHTRETWKIPHEAWLHTESIRLLKSPHKTPFLKMIDKIVNSYLTSVSKLEAVSHQKASQWGISQHICHPLPPPPQILLSLSMSRLLFNSIFTLFLCLLSSLS